MEKRIYLNRGWKFSEEYQPGMLKKDFHDTAMQEVILPHTCKETPYHYFDEHIYQMVSGYRRKLKTPKEWQGKTVILTLEGVAHESEVFLNGEKVGEHRCGYTAFSMDISKQLIYGEENILTVKVDSRESIHVPPFGYVIDYMTYGGIYRDVYLEVKNPSYLQDVFLHSEIQSKVLIKSEAAENSKTAECSQGKTAAVSAAEYSQAKVIAVLASQIEIKQPEEGMLLRQYIKMKGEDEYVLLGQKEISKRESKGESQGDKSAQVKGTDALDSEAGDVQLSDILTVHLQFEIKEAELWSPENPTLYKVKTQLVKGKEVLDENITLSGFRKAEFLKDGFYLNGRKYKIRGLNRHQSYPYVGYAMPKSMQYMDADILKEELGLNAVRTSHYPQSHYFLERCDEIGLLVFTEMPGWQHIGDEEWKAQAVVNTRDMVKQYRNHPSIILWGVRINESKDDDAFYEKTNAAAKELDPYRQTGGVRAHKKSSLLEDVYTYNDFSHDGRAAGCESKKNVTSDMEKPYLISEYNGHMYPTKAFDWEEHRVEHAIRHANVLDAIAGEEDIAGSFGWCMTDYNTHKDFGSGDRICYHGVLDMFRNPKLAADIYACQQEKKQVLSLSSSMDIGEHPGCNRGKTWIFTNADSVKMYKNNRFIKEYKKEDSCYKNLAHGPILIDDFIGDAVIKGENFKPKQAQEITEALNLFARFGPANLPKRVYLTALKMIFLYRMKPTQAVELYNRYIGDWGGTSTVYRFEAIKDQKVIQTLVKEPMTGMELWVEADHTELKEDHTYDVAAVRIRVQDENGNLLSFCNEPVVLNLEGPAELIGESVISLKGGMTGTYIKTTGKAGKAVLTIKTAQAGEVKQEFTISI